MNKLGKKHWKKRITPGYLLILLFVGVFSFVCLYPFLLVISGSFTSRTAATAYGFTLIPKEFTIESYRYLLNNPKSIIDGYRVTIIVTICGTFLALLVNSMMAFVVSRPNVYGAKFLNIYVLITMLFSGGMVPWYIICTRYLHLQDSYLALILPMVVSAWNVFLIRNYFKSMPNELYESAKIDGAQDFTIFLKIYIPLSTPVLAVILLFAALAYWNDWWLGLMLINKDEMLPLQMLLRRIVANIQFLQGMDVSAEMMRMLSTIPGDGVRMALVIITTGPIILLYPFVQRFFVKGIMLGSVKG